MNNKVIGSIILEGASTSEDAIVISDGGKKSKRVIAEGTLQDMDVENRNKRIYSKVDLEPEINGPRMRELIKAKQFKGHAGHPQNERCGTLATTAADGSDLLDDCIETL